MKRTLTAFVFALLFSSIAQAFVEPSWERADVNKDGTSEYVAKTNLADLAFNERGELIGWYLKTVKGTDFKGNYEQAQKMDLITLPSARVGLPSVSTTIQANPVNTQVIDESGEKTLRGVFRYTQNQVRIEKTVQIHPHRLTFELEVTVQGAKNAFLEFNGLAQNRSELKALPEGASGPQALGTVSRARYASIQNGVQALVIHPSVVSSNSTFATTIEPQGEHGRVRIALQDAQPLRLSIYGGPNELVRLKVEGLADLPGLFEPNIFGRLSLVLIAILQWMRQVLGSWGLAIIGITLLVKLVTWPLLQAQLRSTAEMQALQPKVKEINEKFKDKPDKRAQATMELYREHRVNPAAGCLPVFIQLPILLVMYRVIVNFEFDQGFLWLRDLSLPDPIYILPILYIGSIFLQTYISTMGNRDLFRQQLLIQAVFLFFILSFPSGVTMYWILSTLLGVAQQWLINRSIKARMQMVKAA